MESDQEFFYVHSMAALALALPNVKGVEGSDAVPTKEHLAWRMMQFAKLKRASRDDSVVAAQSIVIMHKLAEALGFWDRTESCRLLTRDRNGGFDKPKVDISV